MNKYGTGTEKAISLNESNNAIKDQPSVKRMKAEEFKKK